MSETSVSVDEAAQALRLALELHPTRGIIALIESPRASLAELEAAIAAIAREVDLPAAAVEVLVVEEDLGSHAELTVINRERDLRLRNQRLIAVLVTDGPSTRLARETAPDLLASPDLRLVIAASVDLEGDGAMEAGIRDLMRRRHRELDLTGLLPGTFEKRRVPLSELFMELVDLGERAGEQPRRAMVVLADPGAGKTTLLRHLAVVYADRHADPLGWGDLVPILVPLAEVALERRQDRIRPLLDFIGAWLTAQGIGDHGWNELRSRCLLLLDGIDEIPEPAVRAAVVGEALTLAEGGAVAGVVLTGRSFLVDELRPLLSRCRTRSLVAPARAQIERYLVAFVRLRQVDGAERVGHELARRIWDDPDLRGLVQTPLLLLFLALLHELEGRLPDRRVEIYNRLGELLVDRWVHARSIAERGTRSRSVTRGEVLRVLGPLAWWIVERGGGAVLEQEIEARLTLIEARREDRAEAERRARRVLALLQQDSALLRPETGRRWVFVHHSVAEFFAAREVERDQERWDALLADPFRAEWREIVLFAAGIVGVERGNTARVDELVSAILRGARRAGRYEARHPSLLVGILREDPQLSSAQRRELMGRVCQFWFESAFYPLSAIRVQEEAVAFLDWAAGSALAEVVRTALRRYFRDDGVVGVRWDRLLAASQPPPDDPRWLMSNAIPERRVGLVAGPLAANLPRLLATFGLETAPLAALYRGSELAQLRYLSQLLNR